MAGRALSLPSAAGHACCQEFQPPEASFQRVSAPSLPAGHPSSEPNHRPPSEARRLQAAA